MPSVPTITEETVCEINREFLTRHIGSEDTAAQEQYSKILGRVFPALPFKVRPIPAPSESDASDGDLVRTTAAAVEETLDEVLVEPLSLLQKIGSLFIRSEPMGKSKRQLQSISWHRHRLQLAVVASPEHVLVIDYEQQPEVKSPVVLSHEAHQRGVESLEWRPNAGSTLAVGCKGGVCIWTSSYQGGTIPPTRSSSVSLLGSPTRGGTKLSLVDFLAWGTDLPVSALSWSPCGRLLACGSSFTPTFAVWDVSTRESTPLRRGMAGVELLRWSPLGDYLLAAKVDGSFHLWETMTWTSEPWSSSGGVMAGAAWSPEGRMLVSAFEGSGSTLATLHFAGKPPSLEVHLLPLELPEVGRLVSGSIDRVAWDGTGERLAVSFEGGEEGLYSGLIAVFDTRRTPIISASLLGFVRGPGGGNGEAQRPVCFAFHERLKQGALLGVVWSSGVICVYPLLFRTH